MKKEVHILYITSLQKLGVSVTCDLKGVSKLKDKDLKVPNISKYIKFVRATADYKEKAIDLSIFFLLSYSG